MNSRKESLGVAMPLSGDKFLAGNPADAFGKCASLLKDLNDATEGDFLSIGRRLKEISSQASHITDVALSASEMINSEEIQAKVVRLEKIFDLMGEHFGNSQHDMERSLQNLQSILFLVDKVYPYLAPFKRIVKHLHMLGISTKIESAHIQNSNSNFSVMADDVEKLSQVIDDKTNKMDLSLTSLRGLIQATLSRILAMSDERHASTERTFNDIKAAISMLSQKRRHSLEVAPYLVERSQTISKNISNVVSSLQFHDITRQQIDHTAEALDEVALMASDGAHGRDVMMSILAHAGGLQIEQLKNSRDELLSALKRVVGELKDISRGAMEISTRTKDFIGVNSDSGSSFLTELNRSVSSAVSFFSENDELSMRLSEASRSVSDTTGELARFAEEIEEIGAEIELTALNARIKAAHAAIDGAALDVIAEAITTLSDNAGDQTIAIAETLESIHSAANEMNIGAGTDVLSDGSANGLVKDAKDLCESVQSSEDNILSLLRDLEEETRDLTGSIEGLAGGITVHNRAEKSINDIIKDISVIVARGRDEGCHDGYKKSAQYLDSFASRYTMHQERRIHQAHTGGAGREMGAEYIGDNVELF